MAKKEKYDENSLPRLSKEEIREFENAHREEHYTAQFQFIKKYGWIIALVGYIVIKAFLVYQRNNTPVITGDPLKNIKHTGSSKTPDKRSDK